MPQGRLQLQVRILALFTASSFGLIGNSGVLAAPEKVAGEPTAIAANPFVTGTVSPVGIGTPENWPVKPAQQAAPSQDTSKPEAPAAKPEASSVRAEEEKQPAPLVCWSDPKVEPKAVALCVHGLGLHKGTFEALGKRLSQDGIVTYAIDIRGFGEWMHGEKRAVIDFPQSLNDIKQALEEIHKAYPNLPVIIMGESMGGAIALHATAMYPDLIAGLVSSVPAGDRFGQTETELKVGIRALLGFNKEMKVGQSVVEQATQKEDLRSAWEGDPLARMELSPKELMEFQSFMNKNFQSAQEITSVPVLFIQGMNDKLVRPAGTWKLYDSLSTPSRELVFSKSAEHLIFEEGQFRDDDISFVESWVAKNVLKSPNAFAKEETKPGPEATTKQDNLPAAPSHKSSPSTASDAAAVALVTPKPGYASAPEAVATSNDTELAIAYWIELLRDAKIYRCNNKSIFKTGDSIRFHLLPASDGYAYIVMKQGTTGKKAVLFPEPETGLANDVAAGQDYTMPTKGWLKFDQNPGVEKVSLIFSKKPLDNYGAEESRLLTAYVSSDQSGSKDLIPTRMQLSWDESNPIMIPASFSTASEAHGTSRLENLRSFDAKASMVRVSQKGGSDSISVDIALTHL